MKHVTLDFNEDKNGNMVSVFYSKELKVEDVLAEEEMALFGPLDTLSVENVIENYIEEKKLGRMKGTFRSNVVSNIFAEFTDGFMVKDINFADVEVEFVIKGDRYVLSTVRNSLDGIHSYPFGEMLKVITYGYGDAMVVRKLLEDYNLVYD